VPVRGARVADGDQRHHEDRLRPGLALKDPRKQGSLGELAEWSIEIPPVKVKKSKRERVLSPDEYQKSHRELAAHAAKLVKVLYWTGMRYSEAAGLTWDRVDMKRGLIHHEGQHVRNGKI
jgi:integrase